MNIKCSKWIANSAFNAIQSEGWIPNYTEDTNQMHRHVHLTQRRCFQRNVLDTVVIMPFYNLNFVGKLWGQSDSNQQTETATCTGSSVDSMKVYTVFWYINQVNPISSFIPIYIIQFLSANGFLRTRITESPRKNIFAMYLSLLIGFAFLPFPVFGISYHISLTFSNTMLQCLSKALTRPKSFLLFRQLMRTWVLFLTDDISTDKGPVLNSSSSLCLSSSNVNSLFGLAINLQKEVWNKATKVNIRIGTEVLNQTVY